MFVTYQRTKLNIIAREKKSVKEKDSNEVHPQEFTDMFQKIDSCSDVDINDFESWLEADNGGHYVHLLTRN